MFSGLSSAAVDEVFALNAAYSEDSCTTKINLGIGVYRSEEGASWPLPSVEVAEKRRSKANLDSRHDYLQIQGDPQFLRLAREVVFGESGKVRNRGSSNTNTRIASVQTVSGTGANHLGASFLTRFAGVQRAWIPDPTWSNHHAIWDLAGAKRLLYPYFNQAEHTFNFAGMFETLDNEAQQGDVLVLHACAHNPTGADPSQSQWQSIADLCERKGLIPFFDLAYQGFASGNLDEDAWAIRHFFNRNSMSEFCVAQSFSKNFGLYGQRVGALHVVNGSGSLRVNCAIVSNLCHLIRGEFSMAPRGGSDLVREVLQDPILRRYWLQDLADMSERIKSMRQALYEELCRLETPGSWEHVVNQVCAPR